MYTNVFYFLFQYSVSIFTCTVYCEVEIWYWPAYFWCVISLLKSPKFQMNLMRSCKKRVVKADTTGYLGSGSILHRTNFETKIAGDRILGIFQVKDMLIFITIYRVVLSTKSTTMLYSYSTTSRIVIPCVHAFQTLHTKKSTVS